VKPASVSITFDLPANVARAMDLLAKRMGTTASALMSRTHADVVGPLLAYEERADDARAKQCSIVTGRLALLLRWRRALKDRGPLSISEATERFVRGLRKSRVIVSARTLQMWDANYRQGLPFEDRRLNRPRFKPGDPFGVLLVKAWGTGKHRTMAAAWRAVTEGAERVSIPTRSYRASVKLLVDLGNKGSVERSLKIVR
jgi:hypothetical protein